MVDCLNICIRSLLPDVNPFTALAQKIFFLTSIDTENYQKMIEAIEDVKTLRAIAEMKAGKGRPVAEVFADLRKILNIPPDAKKPKQ